MKVHADEIQTIVVIDPKVVDAAVAAILHPAIPILTDPTAEAAVLAQTADPALQEASLESSGKIDPTTANPKLREMTADLMIVAAMTAAAKETVKNAEDAV